jgi:hypothetical protein
MDFKIDFYTCSELYFWNTEFTLGSGQMGWLHVLSTFFFDRDREGSVMLV